jgi:hypothetical protein
VLRAGIKAALSLVDLDATFVKTEQHSALTVTVKGAPTIDSTPRSRDKALDLGSRG